MFSTVFSVSVLCPCFPPGQAAQRIFSVGIFLLFCREAAFFFSSRASPRMVTIFQASMSTPKYSACGAASSIRRRISASAYGFKNTPPFAR